MSSNEQKNSTDCLKAIQKDIFRIAEECASLKLTKQDISDEIKEQVNSLQKELGSRMVRSHIYYTILIDF